MRGYVEQLTGVFYNGLNPYSNGIYSMRFAILTVKDDYSAS